MKTIYFHEHYEKENFWEFRVNAVLEKTPQQDYMCNLVISSRPDFKFIKTYFMVTNSANGFGNTPQTAYRQAFSLLRQYAKNIRQ